MKDAIAYLRRDIARKQQELAAGTAKSVAFNVKEGALQQRRLDMLVELYPEAAAS